MSWLKLTSGYLYLMKGGSDQYIDRCKINQISSTNQKTLGSIAEFPHEWFESEIQRPKTIIVNLNEDKDGQSKLDSFTTVQLLKRFESPVSYQFFETLKTSKKISELIKKFEDTVGTRFSDEFFVFHDTEKSWKVTSKVRFAEDFDLCTFPLNTINPNDPDADEEEPSFIDILLEVILNSGYTIKPYLLNNPNNESRIVFELSIEKVNAALSPSRITIMTLEKAVIPKEFKRRDENQKVGEVLKQLSEERKIVVNTPSDIADRDAEFNFDGQLTFTDVMDTIALNHGAFWDWQGRDSAFLRRTIAG
jgi:hypothetical protein